MSLNWKEIDAVLDELPLQNSHIQKIIQPDFKSLVFQIYSPRDRFFFLIHLGQGETRLHRVSTRPEKKVKLQRFAQLLRSRIAGGRITEAYQVSGERIVKFTVIRGDEITYLWIRLWGNAANIIATGPEGTILDAFYRRPKKGEISGGTYNPEGELKSREKKEYTLRPIDPGKTVNQQIESDYQTGNGEETEEGLRAELIGLIDQAEGETKRQIQGLEEKLKSFGESEGLKEAGDLISSNIHRIHPGDAWLKTENFFHNNDPVEIQMDPSITPAENAERYYHRYKKAQSGYQYAAGEIEKYKKRLTDLEQLRTKTEESEAPGLLKKTVEELRKKIGTNHRGGQRHETSSTFEKEREIPGLRFNSGGFVIYIGRNAKENDALLRNHVNGNDYWLHTRDCPGGYVFIKTVKGKSVPLDVLLDAGNLAIHYSKAKSSGGGELYYTHVKYLRRAKHGQLGLVIPTQEKNLSITLDEKRIQNLLQQLGDNG